MHEKIPWNDGRHDIRPCSDVDRCDVVRRAIEPALLTFKSISSYSVSLGFISTFGTGPRSSSWVYDLDRDASQSSLVFDKTSQLPECPGMLVSTMSFSNRYPVPDALQIFEDDHLTGVFGFRYQFLGDDMIGIGGESSLLPGESFKMFLCTPGTTLLECCPVFGPFPTNLIDSSPTIGFTVAIDCEVDNSKINPESTQRFDLFRFGDINENTKIEYSFDEYEICLSTDPIHSRSIIITNNNWDFNASFEGQYGNLIEPLPPENSLVVNHSPVWFEFGFDGFISFVDLYNLRYGSHCHLGGEPEFLPDLVIDELLEFNFVSTFILKGNIRDEITSFIEPFHGFFEEFELILIRAEFDLERQYHHMDNIIQCINTFPQVLPWLKPWVSLGVEL